MKHPEHLEDYSSHIAEVFTRAAIGVQSFENLEAFQKDMQAQDAVVRNIEIVGVAANYINRAHLDFMTQHRQIPQVDIPLVICPSLHRGHESAFFQIL